MIELFVVDLDGCLTRPFQSPDWETISEIRKLNIRSREEGHIPPLSICSGRPLPYVEAVAQWLDIRLPVVFENAGLYELASNKITLSQVFDREALREVSQLKEWLESEIISEWEGMELEFSKRMDAGLIHIDSEIIDKVFPRIKEYVSNHFEKFEVHKTDVSVNVILKNNNKYQGVESLCCTLGIKPENTAFIGDSTGDLPALNYIGYPFAPENAITEVKNVARVVPAHSTAAVLEVYKNLIAHNRKMEK